MRTNFYWNDKRVTKKSLVEKFGPEWVEKKVAQAKKRCADDPDLIPEWVVDGVVFRIRFIGWPPEGWGVKITRITIPDSFWEEVIARARAIAENIGADWYIEYDPYSGGLDRLCHEGRHVPTDEELVQWITEWKKDWERFCFANQ